MSFSSNLLWIFFCHLITEASEQQQSHYVIESITLLHYRLIKHEARKKPSAKDPKQFSSLQQSIGSKFSHQAFHHHQQHLRLCKEKLQFWCALNCCENEKVKVWCCVSSPAIVQSSGFAWMGARTPLRADARFLTKCFQQQPHVATRSFPYQTTIT